MNAWFVWQKIIFYYLLPALMVLGLIVMAMDRDRITPCRDTEEKVGRLIISFIALLLFSIVQMIFKLVI